MSARIGSETTGSSVWNDFSGRYEYQGSPQGGGSSKKVSFEEHDHREALGSSSEDYGIEGCVIADEYKN